MQTFFLKMQLHFWNAIVVQKYKTWHFKNAIAISKNAIVILKMQLPFQNVIAFKNYQFNYFKRQLHFKKQAACYASLYIRQTLDSYPDKGISR